MNNIPEFTVDSEILGFELYSESYNEFCKTLDALMSLNNDEMYIEAMDDPRIKAGKGIKKVARRTIETTKDVAGAYGDIIDANGNLIKATWDIVMKSVKLCVRAISWILNKISLVPKFILGTINKIGRVPDYIKAKIRGDIRIYITVDDIALIYNKGLLVDIEQFFSKVEVLAEGEMWGTIFRRRGSKGVTLSPFGQNDKKIIKEMRGIYGNISRINFTPTLVRMKDQKTIDTYFGSKKNINFKDVKGKEHTGTYLEILQQLALTIQNKQNIMKTLQADLQQKFENTRVNQEFGQLHPSDQRYIFDAMKMVTNVITTLGNITRYVMEDVKTINIATETLIKKGVIEPKEGDKTSKDKATGNPYFDKYGKKIFDIHDKSKEWIDYDYHQEMYDMIIEAIRDCKDDFKKKCRHSKDSKSDLYISIFEEKNNQINKMNKLLQSRYGHQCFKTNIFLEFVINKLSIKSDLEKEVHEKLSSKYPNLIKKDK